MSKLRRSAPVESTRRNAPPPFAPERAIIWTHCPKCGDVWTTRAVAPKGACPFCRSKVKIQRPAF